MHASRTGFTGLPPSLPSGRRAPTVPAAARGLVDAAHAAGWDTLIRWCEDSGGAPFLAIDLTTREPDHDLRLTWHSRHHGLDYEWPPYTRDVSELGLRYFGGIVQAPGHRGWRDAPSLRGIHSLIAATI